MERYTLNFEQNFSCIFKLKIHTLRKRQKLEVILKCKEVLH